MHTGQPWSTAAGLKTHTQPLLSTKRDTVTCLPPEQPNRHVVCSQSRLLAFWFTLQIRSRPLTLSWHLLISYVMHAHENLHYFVSLPMCVCVFVLFPRMPHRLFAAKCTCFVTIMPPAFTRYPSITPAPCYLSSQWINLPFCFNMSSSRAILLALDQAFCSFLSSLC